MGAELPPSDVLLADQRRRWGRGERVPVEHFLSRRPDLKDQTEVLLDLIYGEVLLRREAGERPDLAEYVERFPTLADPLRIQFEVDAAIGPTQARPDRSADSTLPRRPAGPPPPAPPGYELVSELGRGGMGVVYLARQVGLDRLVALKMIRSAELADPADRARFESEARAAARLSHPNVVQVYEVGEHLGQPYLALEYVPGGNLADALRGPLLAPAGAAALAATLARAVDHAHSEGIVHRDLKPANILLAGARKPGSGGSQDTSLIPAPAPVSPAVDPMTPKVTDFGLAKRLGADGLTRTGDFIGTPSYAAPEQAAGKDVGPAADVWALGAILYQMLTGHPPFVGDGAVEILDQVRFTDPVPPSRLRPHVPHDLETITLACLRKDLAKRYASASALADDLDRFLSGEPIRARPVGTIELMSKWCRRRPALSGTLAVLAVLTVASLITVTALWLRAARARDAESQARQDEAAARTAERVEFDRAEARGAGLLIANARYAWLTDDLDAARQALAECPPEYRNADWAYLNRACRAVRVLVGPSPSGSSSLAVSPDGARFAVGSAGEHVRVYEAGTGRELAAVSIGYRLVQSLEFTADGRLVAAVSHTDLTGGRRRDTGELVVIDPAAGRFRTAWTLPERPVWFVVSPGGTWAAWVNSNSSVAVARATDAAEPAHRFECKIGIISVLAFSRDGRHLVTAGLPNEVAVRDLETGKTVRRLDPPLPYFGFSVLAVSADARRAVTSNTVGPVSSVDLYFLTPGSEPRRAASGFPLIIGAAFSPNGRRVLAFGNSDSAIRVWDVESGREELVLRGLPTHVRCAAFTPDGRQVMVGYSDGRVALWTIDP